MRGLKGEYRHKLDTKGRVSLPASFRKALPDELVIFISPEGDNLMVFTQEDYEEWLDSLFIPDGGYQFRNPEHRDIRSAINQGARDIEVDSAGRIAIPANQRESVGLDKDVILIGDTDHLKVWDAKRLDERDLRKNLSAWFNQS